MALRTPLIPSRPSLSFALLLSLLAAIWIAGGASRADVPGQLIVRGAAWLALVAGALAADWPRWRDARPVALLLAASITLAALQLVRLPPGLWLELPGRAPFADAALGGAGQPWRPWSIVPGATTNALFSLVVPLTVLLLLLGTTPAERATLPGILLALIVASTLIGLLQFSGAGFNNPLVNDTPGQVSGTFANRNHFALFVAIGCALAPVWAFQGGRRPGWRAPIAFGLLPLFALTILASGSRAGILVGVIGLAAGLIIPWRPLRRELGRYPRWVLPAMIGGFVAMILALVALSIAADRAVSISRVLAIEPGEDMRRRALPTVLELIRTYFPAGSGLGAFDPIFRIHEPFALLTFTYFNHAHNDFLEVVLDTGLPGLLLLSVSLAWWLLASVKAWQKPEALPRLGSALLLLVLVASLFDYPARTPIIMTCVIIAALWLNGERPRNAEGRARPALPIGRTDL